ncbi:hypothetical protein H5410_030612, partial [Solanum commersonii]
SGSTPHKLGASENQKFGKSPQKFKSRKTMFNPNLIGYPYDFEFTKTKGFEGSIKGNTMIKEEEYEYTHGK